MTRPGNVSALARAQPFARSATPPVDFPVREYIGAMARELARLARWDRDEVLAALLEAAGERAAGSARRLTASSASSGCQTVATRVNDPVGTAPARR